MFFFQRDNLFGYEITPRLDFNTAAGVDELFFSRADAVATATYTYVS